MNETRSRQELEARLIELNELTDKWVASLGTYGDTETPVNDWEGRTKEFKKFEEICDERHFIEKLLKWFYCPITSTAGDDTLTKSE